MRSESLREHVVRRLVVTRVWSSLWATAAAAAGDAVAQVAAAAVETDCRTPGVLLPVRLRR